MSTDDSTTVPHTRVEYPSDTSTINSTVTVPQYPFDPYLPVQKPKTRDTTLESVKLPSIPSHVKCRVFLNRMPETPDDPEQTHQPPKPVRKRKPRTEPVRSENPQSVTDPITSKHITEPADPKIDIIWLFLTLIQVVGTTLAFSAILILGSILEAFFFTLERGLSLVWIRCQLSSRRIKFFWRPLILGWLQTIKRQWRSFFKIQTPFRDVSHINLANLPLRRGKSKKNRCSRGAQSMRKIAVPLVDIRNLPHLVAKNIQRPFLVDSGCYHNIISKTDLDEFQKKSGLHLRRFSSDIKLVAHNQTPLEIDEEGVFLPLVFRTLDDQEETIVLPFLIEHGTRSNIIGFRTLQQLNFQFKQKFLTCELLSPAIDNPYVDTGRPVTLVHENSEVTTPTLPHCDTFCNLGTYQDYHELDCTVSHIPEVDCAYAPKLLNDHHYRSKITQLVGIDPVLDDNYKTQPQHMAFLHHSSLFAGQSGMTSIGIPWEKDKPHPDLWHQDDEDEERPSDVTVTEHLHKGNLHFTPRDHQQGRHAAILFAHLPDFECYLCTDQCDCGLADRKQSLLRKYSTDSKSPKIIMTDKACTLIIAMPHCISMKTTDLMWEFAMLIDKHSINCFTFGKLDLTISSQGQELIEMILQTLSSRLYKQQQQFQVTPLDFLSTGVPVSNSFSPFSVDDTRSEVATEPSTMSVSPAHSTHSYTTYTTLADLDRVTPVPPSNEPCGPSRSTGLVHNLDSFNYYISEPQTAPAPDHSQKFPNAENDPIPRSPDTCESAHCPPRDDGIHIAASPRARACMNDTSSPSFTNDTHCPSFDSNPDITRVSAEYNYHVNKSQCPGQDRTKAFPYASNHTAASSHAPNRTGKFPNAQDRTKAFPYAPNCPAASLHAPHRTEKFPKAQDRLNALSHAPNHAAASPHASTWTQKLPNAEDQTTASLDALTCTPASLHAVKDQNPPLNTNLHFEKNQSLRHSYDGGIPHRVLAPPSVQFENRDTGDFDTMLSNSDSRLNEFLKLLFEVHGDTIPKSRNDLGSFKNPNYTMDLKLSDENPEALPRHSPFPVNAFQRKACLRIVSQWVDQRLVEPSSIKSHASRLLIVKKHVNKIDLSRIAQRVKDEHGIDMDATDQGSVFKIDPCYLTDSEISKCYRVVLDARSINTITEMIPPLMQNSLNTIYDLLFSLGEDSPNYKPKDGGTHKLKIKDPSKLKKTYPQLPSTSVHQHWEPPEVDPKHQKRIDEFLNKSENFGSAGNEQLFVSSLDIRAAHNLVRLSPNASSLLNFVTPNFLYFRFIQAPYGLSGISNFFNSSIIDIFSDLIDQGLVTLYADDLLILSYGTLQDHAHLVAEVIKRLSQNGVKVSPNKCFFAIESFRYLGFQFDREGIKLTDERVKALVEFPPPQTVKSLQRYLGSLAYIRIFYPNLASDTAPLTSLLQKNKEYIWTEEHQRCYEKIQKTVQSNLQLSYHKRGDTVYAYCDSSNYAGGCCLFSGDINKPETLKPILFLSRKYSTHQINLYSSLELEIANIIDSLEKIRYLIDFVQIHVYTDAKSLIFMIKSSRIGTQPRLSRLTAKLSSMPVKFTIAYCKPSLPQLQLADALSRSLENNDTKRNLTSKEYRQVTKEDINHNLEGTVTFADLFN